MQVTGGNMQQKNPGYILPAVFIAVCGFAFADNHTGNIYQAAVASPARTAADRERDANRNPAAVLEFFAIKPGMTVLDLFSGGGYYTELLSYTVGDGGKVVAQTNSAYARFVGDEATNRYANNRLSNVEILFAENNELTLTQGEYDAAMMVLAYHDIYYVDPDNGWPKIEGDKLLAEIYRGLKPGGILAVVDHNAAADSSRDAGNTLHRLNREIAVAEIEAAGFVLDGESDILRNSDDDHTLPMSDPKVRGKTDRYVLRFRKPR